MRECPKEGYSTAQDTGKRSLPFLGRNIYFLEVIK